MSLRLFVLATLLATTGLLALAPPATAFDVCQTTRVCLPPDLPPVSGCGLNALAVRTDCNGNVYVCTARYMGGGDPLLVGNLVWTCSAIGIVWS